MKEIVLDIEYCPPSDAFTDNDDLDAQWDAVIHDIADHGWTTEEISEPFQNDSGHMVIGAVLTKECTDKDQSTAFTFLLDICPDIRIVGGGLTTSTKEGGL